MFDWLRDRLERNLYAASGLDFEDGATTKQLVLPTQSQLSSVAVAEGQKVSEGDVLLTIEAMKMETSIHADRAGTSKSVVAPAGTQIDAKDLLLEFA